MYEDVMAITQKPNCNFRKYEMMRLSWLRRELNAAMLRWDEDKIGVKGEDVAYGNGGEGCISFSTRPFGVRFCRHHSHRRAVMGSIWCSPKKGGPGPKMHQRVEVVTSQD